MLEEYFNILYNNKMKLIASAMCKQGGRDYNQDAFKVVLHENGACLVVCDGLGSYFGSEIASATAVNEISGDFSETVHALNLSTDYVKKIVLKAHEAVCAKKEMNYQLSSSCTTLAMLVTDYEKTVCAHIGDSRVYLFKQNKLTFQSVDHSLAQFAVDMGRIKQHQIRSHPDQNKLTRVLGSDYYTAPDIHIPSEKLEVGDAFILCTDGFWEFVYEDEMQEDLSRSATPEAALDKMERRLVKRAHKYNDNYTAIVAYIVE